MDTHQKIAEYLDEHQPDIDDRSYADVADELEGVFDLAHRTLRRWVSRWAEGAIGDTHTKSSVEEPEGSPTDSTIFETPAKQAIHDPHGDFHYVHISGRGLVAIPKDTFRTLKRRYSNWDGSEKTINEICREFGIARRDFVKLKKACGWTHDSAPYTDEELLSEDNDVGDLAEDLARIKERELYREWQNEEERRNQEDADKWRQFEAKTLRPTYERIKATPADSKTRTWDDDQLGDFYAVIHATDAHLDQKNADQTGFEANRRRFLESVAKNLKRVRQFGTPRRIILNLGSDQSNTDGPNGTTAGTPQDNDLVGNDAVFRVFDTGVEAIEMCRDVAPVEVRVVPGNHDWRTSVCYYWGLDGKYDGVDDVTLKGGGEGWQFDTLGKNLCLWTHGHKIKGGETKKNWNLSTHFLQKAPHLIEEGQHNYVFLGHNHHILEKDDGVHTLQGGSTAKTDQWHRVNGYETAKKCQTAYLLAEAGGQFARFTAYVS